MSINATPFDLGAAGAQDFAVRGSAVLGIRDSGKTYTATLIAERLFDAGIPFVSFDPIGVWRFLRTPGAGKGYPIVVAGGKDGDLPLTVESAPEIVRAAMKSGVSLVIDLFDIDLSKADWRCIVTSCVLVLLHENAQYGLRHVFLEEAAEFIPQKPQDWLTYAEVEKLARMGGNSRVGLTIINQRAEEVSKAVLELCDNLFLHRQKGKNSLASLSKWLDVANVANPKEITNSLSTLPTGECWAWLNGTDRPVRTKVPLKNSLHPDRRVLQGDAGAAAAVKPVDASRFVKTIKAALVAKAQPSVPGFTTSVLPKGASGDKPVPDPAAIEAAERRGYERGVADGSEKIMRAVAGLATDLADSIGRAEDACANAKRLLASFSGFVGTQADEVEARRARGAAIEQDQQPFRIPASSSGRIPDFDSGKRGSNPRAGTSAFNSAAQKMLAVLDINPPVRRTWQQVATLAGLRARGGHFNAGRKALIDGAFIVSEGSLIRIAKPTGNATAPTSDPRLLIAMWQASLSGAAPKIMGVLAAGWRTKNQVANELGMQPRGGHWNSAWKELRDNEIVESDGDRFRLSELFRGHP